MMILTPKTPKTPKVIAFGHKRARGKDEAARYVVSRTRDTSIPFQHDFFARSLKMVAGVAFEFSPEQLYGDLKNVVDPFWGITPRKAFQDGGQMFRATFGEDFWTRTLLRRIAAFSGTETGVVVSDLRYLNEAQLLRDVYMDRALLIRLDRITLYAPEVDDHESETSLDGFGEWDVIIDNNGTLPALHRQLDALLRSTGLTLNRQRQLTWV